MAKYYGAVGYAVTKETGLSIWTEQIVERYYKGDVIKRHSRWFSSEQLNDNLEISQEISIVADPYAYEHFHAIRYLVWHGSKWKVTGVEVQRPRLILSIGGVYNDGEEEG